jgi:hypothetical protein
MALFSAVIRLHVRPGWPSVDIARLLVLVVTYGRHSCRSVAAATGDRRQWEGI